MRVQIFNGEDKLVWDFRWKVVEFRGKGIDF